MDKKNSAAGKAGGTVKAKETSDSSTTASTHGRANARMAPRFLLVWLDNSIDDNNADCRNTLTQLRCVINSVNTFTDDDKCFQFIESMDNDKAFMIISGSFGQQIVPRVHDMSQVDSIFIFCGNKKRHEQWAKEWAKIKGVFTDIAPICEVLQRAAEQGDQNAVSISFMATSGDVSNKNLDQLDSSFMYTQILKEILLSIRFEQQHFKEFIQYCREALANNEGDLKNVKKLEREYRDETPIWWYTFESFLYPMLGRAIKTMDVDLIVKMGFFVCDLHRQIEQLHSEQFNGHHHSDIFTVYHGKGVSTADFDRIGKTRGGLISFNNFLSTSKDRQISFEYTRRVVINPDMVGILFVMKIDPSKSTVPFASTAAVSYFRDKEEEVLFSMHTVFRIGDIKSIDGTNRLFQVDLTLTSDTDKDLRMLTDRLREEICQHSNGWCQLGLFLLRTGQPEKAEQVYQIILEQTTEEHEKGNIYQQLGSTKADQGEYREATTFYEKSLEIQQKTLPPNHPDFATSYNGIGSAYYKMDEYSKALSSYEKALQIRQKTLPPNHPDLATSYNNIGLVYYEMDEYSKALSSYEKSLEIRQKTLPPNHPDLATSYHSIGLVYSKMDEHSKALSHYERALEIRQRALPPNHPDLATSYNAIGLVHQNMDDYSKALSFHERAVNIGQNSLPPNHPDLQMYKKNLDLVKKK